MEDPSRQTVQDNAALMEELPSNTHNGNNGSKPLLTKPCAHTNDDDDECVNNNRPSAKTALLPDLPASGGAIKRDLSMPATDMLEIDMSRRQGDLASSNSSSISSLAQPSDSSAMASTVSITNTSSSEALSTKDHSSAMSIPRMSSGNELGTDKPIPQRKKNRRKNAAPKNLNQIREMEMYEEISAYESKETSKQSRNITGVYSDALVKNNESHLSKANNKADDTVLDLSQNTQLPEINGNVVLHEDRFDTDTCGALDLSATSCKKQRFEPKNDNDEDLRVQYVSKLQSATPLCESSTNKSNPPDVMHMKDYAESTVHELLKMYGLGDEPKSTTNQVPLGNFSPDNILRWDMARASGSPLNSTNVTASTRGQTLPYSISTEEESMQSDQGSTFPFQNSPHNSTQADNDEDDTAYQSHKIGAMFGPLKTESGNPDYGKYRDYEHCGQSECQEAQLREHFHCKECPAKYFMKKDEMIRHFKWHRKRDESLQHGFMRYSPVDDCSARFSDCAHNGRQTHYHCIQAGCNKVYISTSDVQMHANYHRKDSAIMQQGFQRFRATEDCATPTCPFHNQRTTHFHCRRPDCSFTFKNKADIEKHKTYHQKDDILAKDGFKKFMKYDSCNFSGCRFSNLSNHIHCIRPGCDYVLHSTSQLLSHKRKHERRQVECAYRRYKDTSHQKVLQLPRAITPKFSAIPQITPEGVSSMHSFQASVPDQYDVQGFVNTQLEPGELSRASDSDNESLEDAVQRQDATTEHVMSEEEMEDEEAEEDESLAGSTDSLNYSRPTDIDFNNIKREEDLRGSLLKSPIEGLSGTSEIVGEAEDARSESPLTGQSPVGFVPKVSPPVNEKRERDETWKKFLTRYTANDPCHSRCQFLYKDHYHCNDATCGTLFRSKDGVRDHARQHETLERITQLSYMSYSTDTPCTKDCLLSAKEQHYHCLWSGCNEVITGSAPSMQRLEHYHVHEYSRSRKPTLPAQLRHEHQLKRRRGRPPKYPKHEIPVVPKIEMDEHMILIQAAKHGANNPIAFGYTKYEENQPCRDDKCIYMLKAHYHCVRRRCHHATDNEDVLTLHAKDFHSYVKIPEGFEFFDRNVNCRRPHCHNNKVNRHFHCVRPKCDYSFVRYSTMSQHNKKHMMAEMGLTISPGVAIPSTSINPAPSAHGVMQQIPRIIGMEASNKNPSAAITLGAYSTPMLPLTVSSPSAEQLLSFTSAQNAAISAIARGAPPTSNPVTPIVIQPIHDQDVARKKLVPVLPKPSSAPTQTTLPLASLLQQKASNQAPLINWTTMLSNMHYSLNTNCGRPFCKLKKKDHYHCFDCNQAFCDPIRLKNHAVKHGLTLDKSNNVSGRLFTKMGSVAVSATGALSGPVSSLTAGASVFSQAPAAGDTLRNHVTHAFTGTFTANDSDSDEDDDKSSSLNLNPQTFTRILQNSQSESGLNRNECLDDSAASIPEVVNDTIMTTAHHTNNSPLHSFRDKTLKSDTSYQATIDDNHNDDHTITGNGLNSNVVAGVIDAKQLPGNTRKRVSNTLAVDGGTAKWRCTIGEDGKPHAEMTRPRKQSTHTDVPEGFLKYVSGDDCALERCTYRRTLTHYHCARKNCHFGTADRNRLLQHAERHRKTDERLGDDFLQSRPSQDCTYDGCTFTGKCTHYHCLKCKFHCLELSKVQAHRKNHQKQEAISAQGFLKVMAVQTCSALEQGCSLSGRVTHYHCLQDDGLCRFVAQGQQAIAAHNKAIHNSTNLSNE